MFRIEAFCEDKNLAKILRLLAGAGVGNVVAVPVVDAPTPVAVANGLGRGGSVVWTAIQTEKLDEFAYKQAGVWLKAAGMSDQAAYALRALIKAKYVKKIGTGKYKVLAS